MGFRKVNDIDLCEFRWLRVSTDGSGEAELLLELSAHPAAKTDQEGNCADGIPTTLFLSEDIHVEHRRLTAKGISFKGKPLENGGAWIAIFDDDCGNWIQLVQV
jgi:hypothetical protein